MTPNIPCYLIRDLLPTYVDGLTSGETSRAIEDHVAACDDCRALLDEMRAPAPVEPGPEDAPQVDYLKKVRRDGNRRSLRNAVIIGIVLASVILAAVWRLLPRDLRSIIPLDDVETMDAHLTVTGLGDFGFYDLEDLTPADQTEKFDISYNLIMGTLRDMKVRPSFRNLLGNIETVSSSKHYDGRSLLISLHGSWDNVNRGIFLDFLDGKTFSITDPHSGDLKIYYVTDPTWLDTVADYMEQTVPGSGDEAAELAPLACEYTGQIHYVEAIIESFAWENTFGDVSHTSRLVDDWTVTLHAVISTAHEPELLRTMQRDSFIMLGLIGDLQTVTWQYECGGETKTQVYTAADATAHVEGRQRMEPDGTLTTFGDIKSFVDFTDRTDTTGVQNLLDAIDGVYMR